MIPPENIGKSLVFWCFNRFKCYNKVSWCKITRIYHRQQTQFWKKYWKIMPNSVIQTPWTQANQSDESFENLLIFDNSVSLHKGNLSFLVTEIFKSVSKANSQFMWFYCSYKNLNILRRGYLQRLQGMERILSILKLFWVTFLFCQIKYLSSWI